MTFILASADYFCGGFWNAPHTSTFTIGIPISQWLISDAKRNICPTT